MEQVRYDLILKERLEFCGCLKFANKHSFHSRIFNYMYAQMKECAEHDRLPTRTPRIFELRVSSKGVLVNTIHRHSGEALKFIEVTDADRNRIGESMDLLENRLANYDIIFVKPKTCDYTRKFIDVHITVEVKKSS